MFSELLFDRQSVCRYDAFFRRTRRAVVWSPLS